MDPQMSQAPAANSASVTDADERVDNPPDRAAGRLVSLDAYRGFVMLLMASEGLGITHVAEAFKDSGFWQFMADQTDHVAWIGCSLWDLIQPSFMFLVGVALPFSIAARQAKGQSFAQMFRHALIRAFALVALGIFLRSEGKPQTYYTFEDVLTQIGLGYPILFLLAFASVRAQLGAALGILGVWWLANVLYPAPGPGTDFAAVGVPPDWNHLGGLAAHFDKNTNLAHGFDQWFLNIFPREKPFVFNGGGYQTLNFIPSLGTMLFGLLAGGLLKSERPAAGKLRTLVVAGVACLVVGNLLGLLGICPVVKRIWTPSWAIYSTGWTLLLLAFFYGVVDVRQKQRWAFPLIVVGMNSIFMYVVSHVMRGWTEDSLRTHLGQNVFKIFGDAWEPMLRMSVVLVLLWLACYWLYRRRIFLRI